MEMGALSYFLQTHFAASISSAVMIGIGRQDAADRYAAPLRAGLKA
jgi:hypothetical protein